MPAFTVRCHRIQTITHIATVEIDAATAEQAQELAAEMNDFGGLNWTEDERVNGVYSYEASPTF